MKNLNLFFPILLGLLLSFFTLSVFADNLEVTGDDIQYSVDGKKVIVTGNVEIKQLDTVLTSDYAEYTKATNTAYARGHVVIVSPEKKVETEEITYDFGQKKVTTDPAKIFAPPAYVSGQKITTNERGAYVIKTGTFTMSDYDDPEYHMAASKMVIDKERNRVTARDLRLKIGDIPIFYLPWYTKNLENTHTPGHHRFGKESDWGYYNLNRWDYNFSENFRTSLALDYRELRGYAEGVDAYYATPDAGSGMIRTYYMDEHNRTDPPMVQTEKYFGEWRHMYRPDDNTHIMAQVFRLNDDGMLGEYFSRSRLYEGDPLPSTFVTATRYLSYGALSFRADPRVNDFYGQNEHLPEVRYDLPNVQIADTGLYWANTTSASYLDHRPAGGSKDDRNNARFDWGQEFSYPFQASIFHLTPFAGSRHTFYRRTLDPLESDIVRGDFNSGVSASTKFFKTYDAHGKFLGEEFNGIRHVITPDVTYEYMSDPTIDANNLYPFDDVDLLDSAQSVRLTLENKVQTTRKMGNTVQILRVLIGTTYNLDKNIGINTGFQTVDVSIDVNPINWMSVAMSGVYDTNRGIISVWNTDLTLSVNKWSIGTGYRYSADDDDLITTYIGFDPDRKWHFKVYERFDMQNSILQEEEYALSRDFHAWVIDMRYNHTFDRGEESWIVFRFKELGSVTKVEEKDDDGAHYYPKEVGVVENINPKMQKRY